MSGKIFLTNFFIFITVSFLGWILEIIYTYIEKGTITNRGFLLGPYCPIYGVGAILLLHTLKPYQNNVWILFTISICITTILEYITSYIMERIFKARWWDYSHMPFHIHGRVCLINSILFGVASTLFIKFLYPFLSYVETHIPTTIYYLALTVFVILFLCDCTISFLIIIKCKYKIIPIQKDSTKEIRMYVKKRMIEITYKVKHKLLTFSLQMKKTLEKI